MTARIYAFHCGGVRGYRGFYDVTDPNAVEVIYEPSMFFAVQRDDTTVLFDTGMNRRMVRTDDGSLGPLVQESDLLPAKLAEVGIALSDVTMVVASHLHDDHAGGLEYLSDQPVYVQRRELAFARAPSVFQRIFYEAEDLGHDTQWVEIDGEHDILGDGALTLLPTPGHTPGHQVLRVRLAEHTYVLCADASYLEAKMRSRKLPGVVWSPDDLLASWELLERIEGDEHATLLFTHDLNFREMKRLAPTQWYE